ncbi:MAG: nucleotidyltransferase family protein [Lentimicrobium sp.]|nr:nucleotidyltransferase family protein [Lentimicrobium sp.]
MKALILAAGLGTRLKPLTNQTPKALLPIGPYTLLQFAILKLKNSGFNELIINVHHHADQVISYLDKNKNFGCTLAISDEREQLLDTGGGIKKAAWFFNDNLPFLVYNVDIVTDLDLQLLYEHHKKYQNIATLVVRDRKTSRYLLFDNNMQLSAWKNVSTGEKRIAKPTAEPLSPYAFSGIHVINPQLFSLMEVQDRFSIIDTYLRIAATHPIGGYLDNSQLWADAGKPESLAEAGEIAEKIRY